MTISTEVLRYRPELDRFEAGLRELNLLEPPTSFCLLNPKTGSTQLMTIQQVIYKGMLETGWRYEGGEYSALIHASSEEVK